MKMVFLTEVKSLEIIIICYYYYEQNVMKLCFRYYKIIKAEKGSEAIKDKLQKVKNKCWKNEKRKKRKVNMY